MYFCVFKCVNSNYEYNMATHSIKETQEIPNKFSKEFILGKTLAKGHFGEINECTHIESNRKFAVKYSPKSTGETKRQQTELKNEIEILKKVKHENIVSYFRDFETINGIFLITELLEGGDLIDYITENEFFTEREAAIYMYQLIGALAYLHDNSVVHQDIKLDNIVIVSPNDKLRIKIVDFGIAIQCGQTEEYLSLQGTTVYSPPEVLCYEPTNSSRDLWSVGISAYVLLSGHFPFDSDKDSELMQQIINVKYEFTEEFIELSENVIEFIRNILQRNKKDRLTANSALQHPWFENSDYLPKTKINTDKLKKFNAKRKWKTTFTAVSVAVALEKHKFKF